MSSVPTSHIGDKSLVTTSHTTDKQPTITSHAEGKKLPIAGHDGSMDMVEYDSSSRYAYPMLMSLFLQTILLF